MITEKQLASIKYLVAQSRHGSLLIKRIFFYLADNSKFLTRPVALTLHENGGWKPEELDNNFKTWHEMVSCNCTLHLDEILNAAGSEYRFDLHYGSFKNGVFDTTGMFAGIPEYLVGDPKLVIPAPKRCTYWLAPGNYPRDVDVLETTRKEIESIDISKGILYEEIAGQAIRKLHKEPMTS